jgi:hypothetical protein
MPSQPSYQDTNISLKTGFKNIQRSTPLGTREEVSKQTINFETDFTILATQLKEIKLTIRPVQLSSTSRKQRHHSQKKTRHPPTATNI